MIETVKVNLLLLTVSTVSCYHFGAQSYGPPLKCVSVYSDSSVDGEQEENERSSSPAGLQSPVMDRNPSPPPDTVDGEENEDLDAIGDTVYSKHWLFSTLTRLIHVGTNSNSISNLEHVIRLFHNEVVWILNLN